MKKQFLLVFIVFVTTCRGQKLSGDENVYVKAKEAFYRSEYNTAIKLYNSLLKKYPQSRYVPESYFWLGYSYMELENPGEAYQHFQTLVRRFPQSRWADDGQVKMIELGKELPDKTITVYRKFVFENPDQQDNEIRYRAFIALSETGNREILPDLIKTIKTEKDPVIRHRLVSGLVYYASPDIVPVVVDIYKTETEIPVKRQLFEILEPINHPSVSNAIEKILLTEPHPMLRRQALEIIEKQSLENINDILLRGYRKESDESLRFRYIQIMSSRLSENKTSLFLDMMKREKSDMIKLMMLDQLTGNITTAHLQRIQKLIATESRPEIKLGLLRLVANLDSEEIAPVFAYALLHEKDRSVRNRALISLESMKKPILFQVVKNIYLLYEDQGQKLLLLHYLEQAPAHVVTPVIKMALSDPDESVKVYALGVMENSTTLPPESLLLQALKDPSPKVRLRALPLLRHLPAEKEQSLLINVIDSEKDNGVLLQAVRQSSRLDRKNCEPVLTKVINENKNIQASLHALQILSEKYPPIALEKARKILVSQADNDLLYAAIKMVADYRDKGSIDTLVKIIQSDTDNEIKKAAFQSLYFIDRSRAEALYYY